MTRLLNRRLTRLILYCLCLIALSGPAGCGGAPRAAGPVLNDGHRVLVLGDSISQDGRYVHYLDAYLLTRYPERHIEIINIGLSSETASGLSEPSHPFPRPHVHNRLDAALQRVRPDVVLVCYGMNDGIYMPLSDERFAAYREGMRHVIDRIQQAGAQPVLLTPPPFDPVPIADRVASAQAAEHDYASPYEGYDDVLAAYGEWLLTLRDEGYVVADVGGEVRRHVAERRQQNPGYTVAGDGIHPGAFGHWLMTQAVLKVLVPAEPYVDFARIDARRGRADADVETLEIGHDGHISFTWTSSVPMPSDPDWPADLIAHEQIGKRFNRHELRVTGLEHAAYTLYENDRRLGRVTRERLAEGVDLLRFDALTTNRRAAELLPLVRERQRMLSAAWREHVGYDFPHRIDALPLDEAEVRAAEIETRIRQLAAPVRLHLRLTPDE